MKENIEDINLSDDEPSIKKISSFKIKKENLETNSIQNDEISYSIINNPIMNALIDYGYDYKLCKKLISYLNPRNVEQAIDYLSIENGIIQHLFIEDLDNENKCKICEKTREEHLINNLNFPSFNLHDNINNTIESQRNSLTTINKSIESRNNSYTINEERNSENISISKNNNSKSQNENYISKSISMKEISITIGETEKRICPICDNEYLKSNQTQLNNCFHTFCKTCWFTYIKNSIIEKKQIKIKCMDHLCTEILSEKFIYTIIKNDKNLIKQFNENKLREEILSNPNKKFCPYPNCNSYAKRKNKNEKKVKCENGHLFCFYCLKEPHDNRECTRELDEKMEEYAKKKFIKKCPNCGCWTEKNEGCNHMTCIECNYQWCWLCNNKYTSDHYTIGKCKGFQFFKPKNENDIQLAFEGKIQLRDDERMDFMYIDDFDFFERENRFVRIDNIFDRERFERFSFFSKFKLFYTFLNFGTIIIIICESGKYLKKVNRNNSSIVILTSCYFIFVILFGFCNFFIQIIFNLFIFFYVAILYSLNRFFEDFDSLRAKIRNCNVFTDYGSSFLDILFEFSSMIISIFFGCSFWIIKYISREGYCRFDLNNNSNKKIFYKFFILTIFIINFSIYPLTILLNCIGIIEERIRTDDFYFFKSHIEDIITGYYFDD